MEKPILRYKKVVDSASRIVVPKSVVAAMGKDFFMEVYSDKIVLKPIEKEGE